MHEDCWNTYQVSDQLACCQEDHSMQGLGTPTAKFQYYT